MGEKARSPKRRRQESGEAAVTTMVGGLEALAVSVATTDDDWPYAKGWLKVEIARRASTD
jgi:hypothetical protein